VGTTDMHKSKFLHAKNISWLKKEHVNTSSSICSPKAEPETDTKNEPQTEKSDKILSKPCKKVILEKP